MKLFYLTEVGFLVEDVDISLTVKLSKDWAGNQIGVMSIVRRSIYEVEVLIFITPNLSHKEFRFFPKNN